MNNECKTFSTSDIILAACLKVSGAELESIKKTDSGKGVFVFNNVSEEYLFQYDLGKVLVEPVNFNNAIKQLTTSVRRMG
jgi:hypothetical protein